MFIRRKHNRSGTISVVVVDKSGDRLIVGYSEDRARKNEHDRNEGVERLRKRYAKGTLTKADINKRGYNKFLSISSGVTVCIDEAKIEEDKVWDGLKGYRTNTDLAADQVYENYQQLWNVERAFRITKGTLEVRPMFHFSEKRIEDAKEGYVVKDDIEYAFDNQVPLWMFGFLY